jgi:hypothetical protein
MALFKADGKKIDTRETTVIFCIEFIIPSGVYDRFEHAWGKKKALRKSCKDRLIDLEGVLDFLQIKNPPNETNMAEKLLSTWTDIMTQQGRIAVRDYLKLKNSTAQKGGWLRHALFGKNIEDPFEYEEINAMLLTSLASRLSPIIDFDFAWGIGADARESLFKTALATTDSMLKLFEIPTSSLSNRLTSPGPVPLHSNNQNAVELNSADEDALNLFTSSSQSNPNVVECDSDENVVTNLNCFGFDSANEDELNLMNESLSSRLNSNTVGFKSAYEDVVTQIERAMNENDETKVFTISQFKKYTAAMSETRAHGVLLKLADESKISRMKFVKMVPEVSYYRLHRQTKEIDPATPPGKRFVCQRSVELYDALQDVKEEMRAPIAKHLAERLGLVAMDKDKINLSPVRLLAIKSILGLSGW